MADLLVRVRAYVSGVNGRQIVTVRNGHRFENSKKDIYLRIGRRFEKLIKEHRSEVPMSVMYKSYMNLRVGCRLEAGCRSESCIYARFKNIFFYIKMCWLSSKEINFFL
jgi:hypothetical protein